MLLQKKAFSMVFMSGVAMLLSQVASAIDVSAKNNFSLAVSKKESRKQSQLLAHSNFWPSQKIHIFLDAPDGENIERVDFYLDDVKMQSAPVGMEKVFPFDFSGGKIDRANALSLADLALGRHTVTANMIYADGAGSKTFSSAFRILPEGEVPRLKKNKNLLFYTDGNYYNRSREYLIDNNRVDGKIFELSESDARDVCFAIADWEREFPDSDEYEMRQFHDVSLILNGIEIGNETSTGVGGADGFFNSRIGACTTLTMLGVGSHTLEASLKYHTADSRDGKIVPGTLMKAQFEIVAGE